MTTKINVFAIVNFHKIFDGFNISEYIYKFVALIESGINKITTTVKLWNQRSVDRNAIAQMNDRMLQDIGMDRVTAHIEMQKPFWTK